MGYRYSTHSERHIRILLFGHYRIAYLIKPDDNVDILGVFHGAMRNRALLVLIQRLTPQFDARSPEPLTYRRHIETPLVRKRVLKQPDAENGTASPDLRCRP